MEDTIMKRAFTLIELLVVIAIIAILAAILFPVFAQAKIAAKKTQAISNAKQSGTAMLLYSGDADDLLPFGIAPRTTNSPFGTWRWDSYQPAPHDWYGASRDFAMVWANSTAQYRKTYELLALSGAPEVRVSGAPYDAPLKKWANVSFTYNGLLQSLSQSNIEEITKLPMIWNGSGNAQEVGFVSTNPVLKCDSKTAGPCKFNDSDVPMPGSTSGSAWFWTGDKTSAWVYGEGAIFVATDSSAKYRPFGKDQAASGSIKSVNDPFSGYDKGAVPTGMWVCNVPGVPRAKYACFFRPDITYDYF
jgi:prepilin-type N-terminal cleavage/methylation domain-containing protein